MSKSYIIRHKTTGVQWQAPSGKRVWAAPGHAKLAWGRMSYRDAVRHGVLEQSTVDEVWAKYGNDRKTPWSVYHKLNELVPKFDEQGVYEIVELVEASQAKLEEAIKLLEAASKACEDFTLHAKIVAFLKKVKED